MGQWVVLVLGAYALGTFPTALLVGRREGFDPSRAGSGNPGASNTFRLGGRRAGLLVLLGDLCKGALATLVGLAVDGRPLAMAAGAAAVVGHIAPVTRRFRGGKGVATAAGLGVVLYPALALVLAGLWAVTAKVTRKASVASLLVVLAVVPALVVLGRPGWEVASVAAIAALIALRHRENLSRLREGREEGLQGSP